VAKPSPARGHTRFAAIRTRFEELQLPPRWPSWLYEFALFGFFSRAWAYPDQSAGWTLVSPAKLGAWYLLMYISFVLVAAVHRPRPREEGVAIGAD